MRPFNDITEIIGTHVKQILSSLPEQVKLNITEIRLRAGKPLCVAANGQELLIAPSGKPVNEPGNAYITTDRDINEALTLISGYSIYAFEEEIKKGFITVKGGHRIGLCGKAVIENNGVKTIKSISSLNIRVSHQIKGAADSVMSAVIKNGKITNTIIVSPPGIGKTTLLRDIVRQLSNGVPALNFNGVSVAVVDERSEIAGTYMGVSQNDIGYKTDVLDGCPKALGMQILLRSMSPICIAVDEIGGKDDISAINEISSAGIKLLCTIHGENLQDLSRKPLFKSIINDGVFETAIVLTKKNTGRNIQIFNGSQIKSHY